MRALATFALLTVAAACTGLSAQSDTAHPPFLWTSGTYADYESSGVQTDGGSTQNSYGPHGELLRTISTGFNTNYFFGLFQSFETNEYSYPERFTFISTEDYTGLTNGYVERKEHVVTTNYTSVDRPFGSGQGWSMAYRTTTMGDGTSSQTISSNRTDWSPDFQRQFAETRDLDGHLLSWSLYAVTNDALHSQQVTLTEYGSDDETHPFFIDSDTKTFDSLGNIILETSETEGAGIDYSSTTSNSYVIAPGRKILSSTAQTVSTYNGAVTGSNVVSSFFEKGSLIEQDSKSFGGDGSLTFETITHFSYDKFGHPSGQDYQEFGSDGSLVERVITTSSYDQFGNLLNQEANYFDSNGFQLLRSTQTDSYVPRGQAVDRPFATQKLLDQIRANHANSSHFRQRTTD